MWAPPVDAVDLTRAVADLRRKGAPPSAIWTPTTPSAGWRSRWPPRRPTWSARRAARTPWPCDYAKIREQYGKSIGSYQAVAHLLAESLALIEGSVSILRHAAWAVDELDPAEAIRAGRFAKVYCARAARTVCETAIQVHGGIGNTWECLAHVFLRRALTSTQLWPVKLEEISVGLP